MTPTWFASEPAPVQALIGLAELSREGYPQQVELIAEAGWPGSVSGGSLAEIVALLDRIDRLTPYSLEAVQAEMGPAVRALDPERLALELVAAFRADVVYKAALVASVRIAVAS